MRSMKLVGLIAMLACTMVYGQSQIVYTLELGGDDHVASWESNANPMPGFTPGSTAGGTTVFNAGANVDLTWAVRVTVGSGSHSSPTSGGPGDGQPPFGAANLVFDLQVLQSDASTPVTFGAAPMTCTSGTPGVTGAAGCKPIGPGFWSQINDGDADGARGALRQDIWANAAFAISLYNSEIAPSQLRALIDPASPAPSGPNFDYGWYPTGKNRGGIDIAGTKAIDQTSTAVTSSSLNGKLVGFGAGYKSYDYTSYRPGVGYGQIDFSNWGFGAGNEGDPVNPTVAERPLFEGQINCSGLTPGTYYLKCTPSQDGNNILQGNVNWSSLTPDYGGFGTFAAKANQVGVLNFGSPNSLQPTGMIKFIVQQGTLPTSIAARKIFYNNSYYDGNNANINPGVSATNNHDDDYDAVDTSKSPLMVGAGTAVFANWTGFAQGINGLIYDIQNATRTPVVGDFTFKDVGKWGTAAGTTVTPNNFVTYTPSAGVTRCVMTFTSTGGSAPSGTVQNTWLQVTIGTGFGLTAAETHWWGNARMDDGTFSGANILVTSTDEIDARNHPRGLSNRAPVDYPYDYNKDSLVTSTDEVLVRNNNQGLSTCVKRAIH